MKKSLVLLATMLLSVSAHAQDKTLTLRMAGTISQETCAVKTNLGRPIVVKTTASSDLYEPNSEASQGTDFTIDVHNCNLGNYTDFKRGQVFNNVTLRFTPSANITPQGTLKGDEDSIAKNVQVQLSENGTKIDLNKGDIQQVSSLSGEKGKIHTFNFNAKFVSAEGGATAGQFWTSVPFEIAYK